MRMVRRSVTKRTRIGRSSPRRRARVALSPRRRRPIRLAPSWATTTGLVWMLRLRQPERLVLLASHWSIGPPPQLFKLRQLALLGLLRPLKPAALLRLLGLPPLLMLPPLALLGRLLRPARPVALLRLVRPPQPLQLGRLARLWLLRLLRPDMPLYLCARPRLLELPVHRPRARQCQRKARRMVSRTTLRLEFDTPVQWKPRRKAKQGKSAGTEPGFDFDSGYHDGKQA